MHATPEQRVEGRRRALLAQGHTPADALALAHEREGVPLPPAEPVDTAEQIEDLHWRHTCELRRADAATARAAKLIREVRILRGVIDALDRDRGSFLINRARILDSEEQAISAARAARRRDRRANPDG